jgi:hypothetical protein
VGAAIGLTRRSVEREIPSASLRPGSSLRLKNGYAQDDADGEKGFEFPRVLNFGGGGAIWLTRRAGQAGDPSLRLKSGYAQDDTAV